MIYQKIDQNQILGLYNTDMNSKMFWVQTLILCVTDSQNVNIN